MVCVRGGVAFSLTSALQWCWYVRDVWCLNFCFSFIALVFSCFDCCPLILRVCCGRLWCQVYSSSFIMEARNDPRITLFQVIGCVFIPRFSYCIRMAIRRCFTKKSCDSECKLFTIVGSHFRLFLGQHLHFYWFILNVSVQFENGNEFNW